MKKGSSRWPAKTLMPPGRSLTAAAASASYSGVERGPMLTGGVRMPVPRTVDLQCSLPCPSPFLSSSSFAVSCSTRVTV